MKTDFSRYDNIPYGPFLEEWKVLSDNENYKISNYGNLVWIPKNRLKIATLNKGYKRVLLWKDNVRKNANIHQLVAREFIPNPNNKPIVNHIRGHKLDNTFTQLEWVTHAENTIHFWSELKGRVMPTRKKIVAINIKTGVKKRYASLYEAMKEGAQRHRIKACINGLINSHLNCKWEYEK